MHVLSQGRIPHSDGSRGFRADFADQHQPQRSQYPHLVPPNSRENKGKAILLAFFSESSGSLFSCLSGWVSIQPTSSSLFAVLGLLWMNEIHLVPPKKPWNVGSPVSTNKQWCQPWFLRWCLRGFRNHQYVRSMVSRFLAPRLRWLGSYASLTSPRQKGAYLSFAQNLVKSSVKFVVLKRHQKDSHTFLELPQFCVGVSISATRRSLKSKLGPMGSEIGSEIEAQHRDVRGLRERLPGSAERRDLPLSR